MKDVKHVITRRDFIRGTIGAAVGTSILGFNWSMGEAKTVGSSLVTIVRDENAMDASKNVNTKILEQMLEQTLIRVTGKDNTKDAWLSLVTPDDMIGLVPTDHLKPTHDEVVSAVKNSLMDAGIPKDRILFAQGSPGMPKKCSALIALRLS